MSVTKSVTLSIHIIFANARKEVFTNNSKTSYCEKEIKTAVGEDNFDTLLIIKKINKHNRDNKAFKKWYAVVSPYLKNGKYFFNKSKKINTKTIK